MNSVTNIVLASCVAACCSAVFGQTTEQPVMLTVEVADIVLYRGNTFDLSRIATNPGLTTSVNTAFLTSVSIADVRTVNGRPAKGIWSYQVVALPFRANPQPGQAIADVDSSGFFQCMWQILSPDGKFIGALFDNGPTAPLANHAITGGTGAFQGITGAHVGVLSTTITPQRGASTSEDPANRRINGGGKARTTLILYPRTRPSVELTPAGPSVFHADFSPVTAANPARAGEVLISAARNLGPTLPDLLPPGTRPFTADPLEPVNSPVEVTMGGREAEVINALGWPGTSDLYRLDFRVPSVAPGLATIQVTAAWIPGPTVQIPVR